jgi:diguanylate cyclase (GGDEF)-like protein/PAS domain S-box-containing protein
MPRSVSDIPSSSVEAVVGGLSLPRRAPLLPLPWMAAVLALAGLLVLGELTALLASLPAAWLQWLRVAEAALAIALIAVLAGALMRSTRELNRAASRATSIEGAIASLSMGVAVWDERDRLIACNNAFRNLYPEIRDRFVVGAHYESLVRDYYAAAPAEVVDGRTLDQFVADSRRRHGDSQVSDTVRRRGDRWLHMTDARTPQGGIISFRMDVTEQHLFELELRKRRKVMDDLAELTYDWFWRTDAEGRFVEFNGSIEQHFRMPAARLLGKTREELPGFEADPEHLARHRAFVAARKPFPWFRYRTIRGDGTPLWIAATGRPILDEKGEFVGYYGAGRDATERESTIASLRASEERFRALTQLATEWYWETDADLRITTVKGPEQYEATLERALVGKTLEMVAQDPNFEFEWPALKARLEARASFRRVPYRVGTDVSGKRGYYEVSAEPIYDRDRFVGYRGLAWDVTEREALIARLTESETRFRALTDLSSDWYWEMDHEFRFTSVRRGSRGGFDLADEEVIGKCRWELPGELINPATWEEHQAHLAAHAPVRDLMMRRLNRHGQIVYHVSSADPVFDAQGRFLGYRGIGKDITEQVRSRENIERLASIDPLTQLPNRQRFDEHATQVLAEAYARGRSCALLFIDLDNFRLLNNGYGHRVGDQVLIEVSRRLQAVVTQPDVLGRRGGDELVGLLTDVPRPEIAVEKAQQLIKSIAEPMRVLGMEVTVTPSVGVAFFPQDGADLDSLLNAADAAMYQAKDNGRKTYAFYTPSVARRVDLRLRLEQRLRKAVETRDFKLFYQPLVSLIDGKMIGSEALIRWKDVELGEISPAEFIPIAEESGLVVQLGDWVVREACRARQVWRQLGLDVPPVAINFSGVQLRQLGCVENLLEILAEYEVNPNETEIEVTETGLLDTSAIARENLVRLRNAGVKLALDDFGVGFSSLSHLRDLPIHRLKIDRSFTVECMRDARTLTIVKAVIEMARSLGIAVTAEGIETQAQQTWMQHLGCDSAQGYLFARPMPADEFLKIFLDRRGVGRERSLMH